MIYLTEFCNRCKDREWNTVCCRSC